MARIDNSHGGTHFDRLFLDVPDKKQVSLDWHEAEKKLRQNWRGYAQQYEKNHNGP